MEYFFKEGGDEGFLNDFCTNFFQINKTLTNIVFNWQKKESSIMYCIRICLGTSEVIY